MTKLLPQQEPPHSIDRMELSRKHLEKAWSQLKVRDIITARAGRNHLFPQLTTAGACR